MSSDVKKRNWFIVIYPESMPKNWKQILRDTGLPIAISPLHEYDVEPTGELKKPHYHVILCYPGPTTKNAVYKFCLSLNTQIYVPIESVKGAYAYLTHKYDPDKYQYSESDIECLNGFNILDYAELTSAEKCALRKEATSLIREYDICEYSDLIDKCEELGRNDLFDICSTSTIYFDSLIRSRRNKKKDHLKEQAAALNQAYKDYADGIVNNKTVSKLLETFGSFEEVDQPE